MRTTLLPETLALIASGKAALVLLIEMQFLSGTLRLATSRMPIPYDGETFVATGLLGAVEEIVDKATEISPQRFTVTGCDPGVMAIVLAEQVRGRPVILRSAWLDAETHALLEAPIIWTGNLDTATPVHDPVSKTASVSVVANHRGVLFNRAKPLRYTHADQQRVLPTFAAPDMALVYIVSQSSRDIRWPASSFFRQ